MKRVYKGVCLVISIILIVSSFLMVFTINKSEDFLKFDFFDSKSVIENIKNYEMNMTSVVYYLDSDGTWKEYQRLHGEENRIWVSIDQMPQQLIDAVVSIEDQRFYDHYGVDWKRTISAFANLVFHFWDSEQGGSTITQQLIKNVTLDNETNASRKVREIFRAVSVEQTLDKRTILEAYLNTIPLGNGICGVQVAANYYFNKDVSELNLLECASIAGITKNPSAYDPIYHPDGNLERRNMVLDKMFELGKITEKQYYDNYNTNIILDPSQQSNFEAEINSYFIDTLIQDASERLAEVYGCSVDEATMKIYNGGYRIYSSLNLGIQNIMDEVYNDEDFFSQISKKNGDRIQSAMTVMDYTGHIVGIVGGVGEKTTNRGLNRATDSPRQPGSTMKPIGVYCQAIDNGQISGGTVIEDKPIEKFFPDGKPGPYEWYGYYAGFMSVESALERSANTIPCWVLRDEVGVEESYSFLTEKLHLEHLTEEDKNLGALALGGCQYGITTTESAAAYAIFGNQGKYYKPTTFYTIYDKDNNLVVNTDNDGEQVIKPGTATIMHNLLRNVVYGPNGTGGGIAGYSRMRAYAKTGTSNDSNDLWMVAGTPYYIGSVWYGFDHYETIRNQGAAATVWRAVMSQVHSQLEYREFDLSDQVVKKTYCRTSGNLAGRGCTDLATGYYLPDTEYDYCNGNHAAYINQNSSNSSSSSDTSSSSSSSQPGSDNPQPQPQPPPTESQSNSASP